MGCYLAEMPAVIQDLLLPDGLLPSCCQAVANCYDAKGLYESVQAKDVLKRLFATCCLSRG
jgi:hypothetical protein